MANEDGNTRSYRYEKDWPNNNSVISVRTKYPERVVELLNWMYTEEGRMITNFGEGGVNYTVDEDGTIVTSQDMIDAQAGASDVAAAVRGELGLGLQGLAQYVDESLDAQITDPIMVENAERRSQSGPKKVSSTIIRCGRPSQKKRLPVSPSWNLISTTYSTRRSMALLPENPPWMTGQAL